MKKVFVDTNIIIDFTKGHNKVLKELFDKQKRGVLELYINPVIIAEFFNDQSLNEKEKELKGREFLSFFNIVSLNKETGIIVGRLLRNNQISYLADGFIAASCLQHSLLLATNNKKDFNRIRELEFYDY